MDDAARKHDRDDDATPAETAPVEAPGADAPVAPAASEPAASEESPAPETEDAPVLPPAPAPEAAADGSPVPDAPDTDASGADAPAPTGRIARVLREHAVDALASAGVALGTVLLAGLVLVGAVVVAFADVPGSAEVLGSVLGLFFSGAAFVLGGELSLSSSAGGGMFAGSIGASLWALPLLLTGAVAVVAFGWAVRQERRHALQGHGWRLVYGVAVGLVVSALVTVLAAIFSLGGQGAGFSVTVTAAGARSLIIGTLVIGVAVFLGRLLGAALAPGESLRAGLVRVIGRAPRVVRETLHYLLVLGAVFVVVALLAAVVVPIVQGTATAVPLAVVLLLNITAVLGVLGQLGGIEISAGASSGFGSAETVTAIGAGNLWLWLVVLVALLASVVAAVRIGTRRPRGEGWRPALLWRMPVAVFAAWVVFSLLLFGVAVSGGGSVAMFGAGGSMALSMSWWSPFVLLLWAAAVEAGATVLPGFFFGLSRRLHEVVAGTAAVAAWAQAPSVVPAPAATGATTAPGDAPAPVGDDPAAVPAEPRPLSPRARKAVLWSAVGVGAVVVLSVAGAVTLSVVNAARGPVGVAEQYLGHLAEGRAEAAGAMVDPNVPTAERALLTDAVLQSAVERITDVRVSDAVGNGDVRTLTVLYKLDGVDQRATLEAERAPSDWGVLENWRLTTPLVATAYIAADGPRLAEIGGTQVSMGADSYRATVPVYPAVYRVEAVGDGFYDAEPQLLVATTGNLGMGGQLVELHYRPTEALEALVEDEVTALLSGCAAQTVANPADCPFSAFVYPADTPVAWQIVTEPEVEFRSGGTEFTASDGVARATYVSQGLGGGRERTSDARISLRGEIEMVDGAPEVTFRSSWW